MSSRLLFRILVLCCLLPAGQSASGQAARPQSFAGISFGTPYEEVWQALTTRQGVVLPPAMSPAGDRIDATGGDFGGREVVSWALEFVDRKFCAASVVVKPASTPLALYRELKQQLVAKYGPPTGERKPPLSEPDRKVRARATRDTVGLVSYWKFNPAISDRNVRSIVCEAAGLGGFDVFEEPLLIITIRYIDETLKAVQPKPATPGPKAPKRDDF